MPKAIELWRSSRTLQLVSRASYHSHIFQAFNAAAQRDSKVQLQIGEDAKREALAMKAMKAIAVVTMNFLPATFVFVSLPVAMYRPSCVHVWLTERFT
jgi:hypothetical protein